MNRTVILTLLAGVATAASAQTTPPASDKIKDYLVDIAPGPVSAAEMLGVSASAVTNIQALKDLNVLLQPGTSTDQKAGFGLEITPLRTKWSSVSATQYRSNPAVRLMASTSLSYAKKSAKYGTVDYSQQAIAVHASHFLDSKNDPIVAAHAAFETCIELGEIETRKVKGLLAATSAKLAQLQLQDVAAGRPPRKDLTQSERADVEEAFLKGSEFSAWVEDANKAVKQCVAKAAKAKWNAKAVAVTLGSAWISPEAGGTRLTLARTLSVSATFDVGPDGGVNLVAKRAQKELDTSTLGGTIVHKNRTLLAGRYTYRGPEDSKLFGIVEVSNAKKGTGTSTDSAFKYALGVDARVAEGFWLEFRVGRAVTASGAKEETKGLVNFKWSPTPDLPQLWEKKS